MQIDELCNIAYEVAASKGFHDQDVNVSFGDRIALVHTEVSEAMEAYRKHGLKEWYYPGTLKPEGVASELADVVIRVADMAKTHGVDLQKAIVQKLEYNKTRPYMHGLDKTNPLSRV